MRRRLTKWLWTETHPEFDAINLDAVCLFGVGHVKIVLALLLFTAFGEPSTPNLQDSLDFLRGGVFLDERINVSKLSVLLSFPSIYAVSHSRGHNFVRRPGHKERTITCNIKLSN